MIISPIGLVRDVPATLSQPGQADALLNLRPQGGGWKVVGPKQPLYPAYSRGATLLQAHTHTLASRQQLVAVRLWPDGSLQLAAAPLAEDASTPVWQELYRYPQGTTPAQALNTHVAFVGNYCCANVPQLRVFRFNGDGYTEEASAMAGAPALAYRVQGRYAAAGSRLSFGVPVRGENLEGCYYREAASGQYTPQALASTTDEGVCLQQGTDNTPTKWGNLTFGEEEKKLLLRAMAGQYTAMQEASPFFREGYVLLCSAWQLADGTYTTPSEPVLLHLGCEDVWADYSQQTGQDFDPTRHTDVFFNRDKIAFRQFSASGISPSAPAQAAFSCQVRRQWVQQLSISKPPLPPSGGTYQKAAFFVSPPVSMYRLEDADFDHLHTIYHYGLDAATKGLVPGGSGTGSFFRLALNHAPTHREGLAEYLPTPADVATWLLYKAVEFDLSDPDEPDAKPVDFGTLATGELLKADLAGHLAVDCAGLLAYNQRLHVWNCATRLKGQPVAQTSLADVPCGFVFSYTEAPLTPFITQRQVVAGAHGAPFARAVGQLGAAPLTAVVACYRLSQGDQHLYHYRTLRCRLAFASASGEPWLALPRFLSFPDARCTQCTLYYADARGQWRATPLAMRPSAGFNFAFALHLAAADGMNSPQAAYRPLSGGAPLSPQLAARLLQADGQTYDQPLTESGGGAPGAALRLPDLLMVSAPANPYVFPPQLAFLYGAEVAAAAVSTREISSAQAGQYPLAVFTQGGIYSMELGTEAFYRRQVPISEEVATGGRALPTPFGVVFISAGGPQLLQGRQCKPLGPAGQHRLRNAVYTA